MDKIPYLVYESTMARFERTIKRLWILAIILVALLVGSNLCWIYYESQFVEVSDEVSQEVDGDGSYNTYIGGDSYGESKADNQNN